MNAPKHREQLRFDFAGLFWMFVALALGLLLLRTVGAHFTGSRRAPKNTCIANLKQIDGAKEQWALDHEKPKGAPADSVAINSYLMNSQPLICPTKGVYTYNPVGSNPICSRGPTQGHTL